MFGPTPNEELLIQLSEAAAEPVRVKAAMLLALHPSNRGADRLQAMLGDGDKRVQRAACEAILRSGQLPADAEALLPLLGDEDRTLAFVARRVLERMPVEQWRDTILSSSDPRVSIVGMLALVDADPTEATCMQVLGRVSELMTEFLSDADFIDTLRLCQLALHRGKIVYKNV